MAVNILDYPFDAALILQKKRAIRRELLAKEGLIPTKVAVLSGVTVGVFNDLLEIFLLANGIRPEFYQGEYALFYENLVFDDGSLKAFAPDLIYIHTSMRKTCYFSLNETPVVLPRRICATCLP